MTALPALVLATLAALAGCSATCLDAAPLEALGPEEASPLLDRIEVDPTTTSPLHLSRSGPPALGPHAQAASLLPDGLLSELTSTHLPTGDARLSTSTAGHAPSASARSSLEQQDHAQSPQPADEAPVAFQHVSSTMRDEPTARGHLAYEARTSAHAHGAPVSGDATALSLSLLVALAAVGLYHKLTKERALEHETRRRILAMLEEEPSLGTMDIANRLEVCYRTARHHLEVLARFDLVAQSEHRGSWRWARPENTAAMQEEHVPEIQQRMLALLDEDPGLHLSEIARRLDAAKATVKLHLDRLDEGGRVRDERVGPLRRFFPVENEAPGSRETSP